MDLTKRMEQFSRAYVSAVAAVAGCNIFNWDIDDDSIDVGFGRRAGHVRLEAQLKSSYRQQAGEDGLSLPIPVKNYNDLRANVVVPRVLIALSLPSEVPDDWLDQNVERLSLMRCAWWVSLAGEPDTPNTNNITVRLPAENVFAAESLATMMDTVDAGGDL